MSPSYCTSWHGNSSRLCDFDFISSTTYIFYLTAWINSHQGEVQSLRYKREDIIRNPKPLAPHGLCIRKRSSIERSISAAVGLLESEPETRSDDGDVPTEKADDEGDGTADDHGDSVEDVPDNSVGGSDIEDSDVEDSCVDDSEENSSEVDDDDGRMARAPIAVGGYFGYGYSMRKSSGPLRPPGVQLREYKSRKNHRFSGGQTEDSSDGSTTNFAQASTAPLRRRKIPVAATALLLSTVGTASVPPSSVLKTRLLTRPRVRKLDTGGYLQRTKYFCCKKLGCVPGSATRNEPFTLTANCKESSRFPEAVVGLSIFETNGMNIGIADGVECPVGSSGPRQDSGRFMESQTPSKEAKFMMNEYDTYIGGCQGSSAEIPKFNKRSDYRASDEMPNIVALKDLACT